MVPDNRAVECGENGSGSAANAADRARALCLRQLTAGPRTADQLAQAMSRGGIESDVVVTVLARLTDVGLIDDEAFAAAWVESRHSRRGTSRRALAQELRTRGVADDLIGAAVGRLDPDREAATARGSPGGDWRPLGVWTPWFDSVGLPQRSLARDIHRR